MIWFWDPDLYCTVTPVIQYQCTNGLDAWTRACRAYCPRVPTHRSRCIYGQISSTLPIEGQDQPCLFQLKTKSLGDTPNYTRNHPKCFFLGGWEIASGTIFVISATRGRREWFPSLHLAPSYVLWSSGVYCCLDSRPYHEQKHYVWEHLIFFRKILEIDRNERSKLMVLG